MLFRQRLKEKSGLGLHPDNVFQLRPSSLPPGACNALSNNIYAHAKLRRMGRRIRGQVMSMPAANLERQPGAAAQTGPKIVAQLG